MHHTVSQLQRSRATIEVIIAADEQEPYLLEAAKILGARLKIPGFRDGSAPFHIVKNHVGSRELYKEATEGMIHSTLPRIIAEGALETVGPPEIIVKKMAKDNDFVYTATVSLLPKITLPDLSKIAVTQRKVVVEEKEVDEAIEELRALRASEVKSADAAGPHDRVVVDLDLYKNGVLLEGGSTRNHSVVLDEEAYVPGLTDALRGARTGEEKTFTLTFPQAHYQKRLAGAPVEFRAKIHGVFARTLPEADDTFAQTLGQPSLAALTALLKKNITEEKQKKEGERVELEMLDALIGKTFFGEIPDILITAEKEKMLAELNAELAEHGTSLDAYVRDLNTTPEAIAEGLVGRAEKRVRAALLLHAFAKTKDIVATQNEFDAECARIRDTYRDNPSLEERIEDPEIQAYIRTNLKHRKVIAALREKLIRAPSP